jgi:hypothetical protein
MKILREKLVKAGFKIVAISPMSKMVSVDGGKPITFDEFLEVNDEALTKEDADKLTKAKVGDVVRFGGGAAPIIEVKRTK